LDGEGKRRILRFRAVCPFIIIAMRHGGNGWETRIRLLMIPIVGVVVSETNRRSAGFRGKRNERLFPEGVSMFILLQTTLPLWPGWNKELFFVGQGIVALSKVLVLLGVVRAQGCDKDIFRYLIFES